MQFPHLVGKPWGHEVWFANNAEKDYCGKTLVISASYRLSLHRHLVKDETFYIDRGDAIVETGIPGEDGYQVLMLRRGATIHIAPGVWHRVTATDHLVRIIEVSTFHSDEDVERLQPGGYCDWRATFAFGPDQCDGLVEIPTKP